MPAALRPHRPRPRALLGLALACLLLVAAPARADDDGREKVERYPPSFRLAVAEAIRRGVEHLKAVQAVAGTWGDPAHDQAMGHTALPLLALLKAGVPADDPYVRRGLRALEGMANQRVYSVALRLMVIHALYEPTLDTKDTDVGTRRAERADPKAVREKLTPAHAKLVEEGLDYLLRAQNASGLWAYDVPATEDFVRRDLSNVQYALLGLRAAADCGFKVKARVWQDALRALLTHQDVDGPAIDLEHREARDGYVTTGTEKAEVRGFHYRADKKDGPLGEKTLWAVPATGSMTTAGIACMAICQEGLWRSRRFRGGDRKRSRLSIRDGLAWMQEHFTVTTNPGHPSGAHHMYYLYGLERMGMLTGTRWIGKHDWYKEGADLILSQQEEVRGGWGGHVRTAFAILFLKRATRATDTVVLTD